MRLLQYDVEKAEFSPSHFHDVLDTASHRFFHYFILFQFSICSEYGICFLGPSDTDSTHINADRLSVHVANTCLVKKLRKSLTASVV